MNSFITIHLQKLLNIFSALRTIRSEIKKNERKENDMKPINNGYL